MFKALYKSTKSKKGFTLTELIVVVAILGILAAVATPSILNYLDDAKVSADNANARSIETAVARLVTKGTVDLTPSTGDADADIVAAITAELGGTLPTIQQSGMHFLLTRATGKITVSSADEVADASLYIE